MTQRAQTLQGFVNHPIFISKSKCGLMMDPNQKLPKTYLNYNPIAATQ